MQPKRKSKKKQAVKRAPVARKSGVKRRGAVKKRGGVKKPVRGRKKTVRRAVANKPKTRRPALRKAKARKPAPRKAAARKAVSRRPKALKPTARKSATRKAATRTSSAKKKVTARARSKAPVKRPGKRGTSVHGAHRPPVNPPFPAYSGGLPYLFVSYAHQDMKTVFGVIRKLNDSRYRIWYDEGIEPGNEWPEVVGKAIINCGQFLVFMSPHAARSRNVRNEINLAFTENKDILVAYLKSARLTEGMKLQIGTVQSINKFELPEREFTEKLKKVIGSSVR